MVTLQLFSAGFLTLFFSAMTTQRRGLRR